MYFVYLEVITILVYHNLSLVIDTIALDMLWNDWVLYSIMKLFLMTMFALHWRMCNHSTFQSCDWHCNTTRHSYICVCSPKTKETIKTKLSLNYTRSSAQSGHTMSNCKMTHVKSKPSAYKQDLFTQTSTPMF